MISREQLLALGFTRAAIKHRLRIGRLHQVHPGVYAVGRPELTREGRWMAAILAVGEAAALSHASAALLLGLIREEGGSIHVSTETATHHRLPGIEVHRRQSLRTTKRHHIPVTIPAETLLDLATTLDPDPLEAAVNEADKRGLVNPEQLRRHLDTVGRRPGKVVLARLLDRHTFRLTDSELERRFLRIVERAGLPLPQTRDRDHGPRKDFFWPELGLIVERDGLTYHRTAAQQAKDRRRDQHHAALGFTTLRFTAHQVRYEPDDVARTLTAVARRLSESRPRGR